MAFDDGFSLASAYGFLQAAWLFRVVGAIWCALLVLALLMIATEAGAQECPTNADQIATDRPDITNSSLVVPTGACRLRTASTGWSGTGRTRSMEPIRDCGSVSLIAPNS